MEEVLDKLAQIVVIITAIVFIIFISGFIHKCPNCGKWFALDKKPHDHRRQYRCKHCGHNHII